MATRNYKLQNELDVRFGHLSQGGMVAMDIPDNHTARIALFRAVRERGDALYGPTGYQTTVAGPRLIINRAPDDR